MSPGEWAAIWSGVGTMGSCVIAYVIAARTSGKVAGSQQTEIEHLKENLKELKIDLKEYFGGKFDALAEKIDSEREHHKSLGKAVRGIDNEPPLVVQRTECDSRNALNTERWETLRQCIDRVENLAERNKQHATRGKDEINKSVRFIKKELEKIPSLESDVKHLNKEAEKFDKLFERVGNLEKQSAAARGV